MKVKQVTLIDYGIGNLWSVASAIKYLGADVEVISDPEKISRSSNLILPGLGSFRKPNKNIVSFF